MKKEDQIKITAVHSDYFKDTYFAERPISERLMTNKLDLRGVNQMRDWKVALDDYIDSYYQNYFDE